MDIDHLLLEPAAVQLHLHPPVWLTSSAVAYSPRLLGLDLDRFERYSRVGGVAGLRGDWTAMVPTTATDGGRGGQGGRPLRTQV